MKGKVLRARELSLGPEAVGPHTSIPAARDGHPRGRNDRGSE